MKISPLTPIQKEISDHYFSLFYSITMKIIRNKFGTRFNRNDEKCNNFYSAALDSYFYSIRKFNVPLEELKEDYGNIDGPENKFINFMYQNIIYFILNAIAKYKNIEVSIDSREDIYDILTNQTPVIEEIVILDNWGDVQDNISKFIKTNLISLGLKKNQIEYILRKIFSKENYEYLYKKKYNINNIGTNFFSHFFKSIFEEYVKDESIDKNGFNLNTFKTFKMKIYPILKQFLIFCSE